MKSNYDTFSEQIAELEASIKRDEDEFSKLHIKCDTLKKEYERKQSSAKFYSDAVFYKFIATVIITIVLCVIFLIADMSESVFTLIVLAIVIYNIVVWEDRSSRNEYEREEESKQRELSFAESDYNKFKAKLDKSKSDCSLLKKNFSNWQEEKNRLIREISGLKPYQYLGFPFDPVIDDNYYPIGTIDEPQKYMVYTANAHRYHKKCGCSGAYKLTPIAKALKNNQTPCLICFGYSNDLEYPDWFYTVHDKYVRLVRELDAHDIMVYVNLNNQLFFNIKYDFKLIDPENFSLSQNFLDLYIETGEKKLMLMIWQTFSSVYTLILNVQTHIVSGTAIVHSASLIHSIFRVALEEHLNFDWTGLKADIDNFFINILKIPNPKLYLSCSDFYYDYFYSVYFDSDQIEPVGFWMDDSFRHKYKESKDYPWRYMCLTRIIAFGDIVINGHLSSNLNLSSDYSECVFPSHSDNDLLLFRDSLMAELTDKLLDFFDNSWQILDNWNI